MTHISKNQAITHNNKSAINNTYLFSNEMSIALIYRPLNFCLLMQHTWLCYIVGHEPRIQHSDYHWVNEAASLTVAQSWLWVSQVTVIKNTVAYGTFSWHHWGSYTSSKILGPPLKLGSPLIPKLQVPLTLSGRTFSYFGAP